MIVLNSIPSNCYLHLSCMENNEVINYYIERNTNNLILQSHSIIILFKNVFLEVLSKESIELYIKQLKIIKNNDVNR